MFKTFFRGVSAAVVTSVVLTTGTSQACCFSDWCCSWFKPKEPVCPAPAPTCTVCPQQVSYVPQTSYRTEYACVPCTSCQPVASCNPCGGSQTVMQPVTSYVQRPVMVPYTSYRPVVTNYAPAPACSTCGGGTPYYGGAAYAPATSGCSTCGGGASVSYAQPAMAVAPVAASTAYASPAYAAAPAYGAPPNYAAAPQYSAQPSYAMPPSGVQGMSSPTITSPAMGSPTLAPPPGSGAPNTFQPSGNVPQTNSSLMPTTPIPDSDKFNSGSAPRLLDPQSRTTSASPMAPPMVTPAIFNTADRSQVFHTAGYRGQNDGWSAADNNSAVTSGGWQATAGQ